MKYRFTYIYKGLPESTGPFEAISDQAASDIAKAMVKDREAQGGYSNYHLCRIDQEERTFGLPIPGLHEGPACSTCGNYMITSGDYYKCTDCGSTKKIFTTSP